jgi:hypothetical protein
MPYFLRIYQGVSLRTAYIIILISEQLWDRLCGLVVRVPSYRSGGPEFHSRALQGKKSSGPGTGSTQPREYN